MSADFKRKGEKCFMEKFTQNIDGRIIADDDLSEVCRRRIDIAKATYLDPAKKQKQRDEVLDEYDQKQ